MLVVQNIIRSAVRKKDEKLHILVFHDMYHEYIYKLSELNHTFYIPQDFCPQNKITHDTKPKNIVLLNSLMKTVSPYFDAIVVFNRFGVYEKAKNLALGMHIPLIIIDFAHFNTKAAIPFFSYFQLPNPENFINHTGDIHVGISKIISDSWSLNQRNIGTAIGYPPNLIKTVREGKILIDNMIPKQYIDTLPFKLDSKVFTFNPEEASLYLHLWQCPTTLLYDCMLSKIPVVTFPSIDLSDIISDKACITIKEMRDVMHPRFLHEIFNLPQLEEIKSTAYNTVKNNSIESFKNSWTNVFNFVTNGPYIRK